MNTPPRLFGFFPFSRCVRLLKLCPKLLRSLLQFLPVVAPRFFLSVNDQAKAVLIPCPANDDRSLRHPAFVVECRGVVDLGRDPGFKVPCEGKGCFFEEGVGCTLSSSITFRTIISVDTHSSNTL